MSRCPTRRRPTSWPTSAPTPSARSVPPTRSASARRAIRADNTDASGLIAALPGDFDPGGRPGARARRRRLGPGVSPGRSIAGRGRRHDRQPDAERRPVELARELGIYALEGAGPRRARLDLEALRSARQRDLGRPCKGGCGAARARCRPKGPAPAGRSVVLPPCWWWTSYTGPRPTELAATCTSGGATLIDGLEILVRQGADSFRIWVGLEPPIDIMRNAVREQPMSDPTDRYGHLRRSRRSAAARRSTRSPSSSGPPGLTSPRTRSHSGRFITDVVVDLGYLSPRAGRPGDHRGPGRRVAPRRP